MIAEVSNSTATISVVVSLDMCAILDDSLIHSVYSTFWLCYHAEVAARKAIEPFFENGENAVGGEIRLRHEMMCAVGDTVRITARVTSVSPRKIVCDIEAISSHGRIASGHQTQIIMSQSEIDAAIAKAYEGIDTPSLGTS